MNKFKKGDYIRIVNNKGWQTLDMYRIFKIEGVIPDTKEENSLVCLENYPPMFTYRLKKVTKIESELFYESDR